MDLRRPNVQRVDLRPRQRDNPFKQLDPVGFSPRHSMSWFSPFSTTSHACEYAVFLWSELGLFHSSTEAWLCFHSPEATETLGTSTSSRLRGATPGRLRGETPPVTRRFGAFPTRNPHHAKEQRPDRSRRNSLPTSCCIRRAPWRASRCVARGALRGATRFSKGLKEGGKGGDTVCQMPNAELAVARGTT